MINSSKSECKRSVPIFFEIALLLHRRSESLLRKCKLICRRENNPCNRAVFLFLPSLMVVCVSLPISMFCGPPNSGVANNRVSIFCDPTSGLGPYQYLRLILSFTIATSVSLLSTYYFPPHFRFAITQRLLGKESWHLWKAIFVVRFEYIWNQFHNRSHHYRRKIFRLNLYPQGRAGKYAWKDCEFWIFSLFSQWDGGRCTSFSPFPPHLEWR